MPGISLISSRAQRTIFLAKLIKAKGWRAVFRYFEERTAAHVEVLCTCPNVILITANRPREEVHLRLADLDVFFLLRFSWAILSSEEISKVVDQIREESIRYPNHQFTALCNEEWQVAHFQALGVDAVFVSTSAFVNESYFYPEAKEDIQYAAVYNAAMAPYKRYELAAKIRSMMAITYKYQGTYASGYEDKIKKELPFAYWVNDQLAKGRKVGPEVLRSLYAKCGVGLCLSEVEGAMFASIEYLLCGLPIVSTYSRGGRDAFFDNRFVRVVPPDPDSVAEAVDELNTMHIDRKAVREETLRKIRNHRERFAGALMKYGATVNIPWRPGTHGPVTYRKYREIEQLVRSGSTSV